MDYFWDNNLSSGVIQDNMITDASVLKLAKTAKYLVEVGFTK